MNVTEKCGTQHRGVAQLGTEASARPHGSFSPASSTVTAAPAQPQQALAWRFKDQSSHSVPATKEQSWRTRTPRRESYVEHRVESAQYTQLTGESRKTPGLMVN